MAKNARKGRPTLHGEEKERVRQAVERLWKDPFDSNQSRMAGAFKVAQPTIAKWLSGDASPGLHNLRIIARFLRISLDELQTGVAAVSQGAPGALDVALLYDPERWPPEVVQRARVLAQVERHTPREWTRLLDEIRNSL